MTEVPYGIILFALKRNGDIAVIFKLFRDNITKNLNDLINGKSISFTHAKFYNWEFKVVAVRKDDELERLKMEEQFTFECGGEG